MVVVVERVLEGRVEDEVNCCKALDDAVELDRVKLLLVDEEVGTKLVEKPLLVIDMVLLKVVAKMTVLVPVVDVLATPTEEADD